MSENDPYGSKGGARNDRPYPYRNVAAPRLREFRRFMNNPGFEKCWRITSS